MVNLILGGIIATVSVVALGVFIALPPFFQPIPHTNALLAFSIVSDDNMPAWCIEISELLRKNNIGASVFVSGKLAQEYSECLTTFDQGTTDIGSSTYNYTDITRNADYLELLNEVRSGKEAVDGVAGIDSKSFKAPFGKTDDNIYSILNRSGIAADFSYNDHYNKYSHDQFIRFDVDVYDATSNSDFKTFLDSRANNEKPIQVNMDNTISVSEVSIIINDLREKGVVIINGSTLTGIELNGGGS